MFATTTRQGLFVLIILAVRLVAQDAVPVYSHLVKAPDYLATSVVPLFVKSATGLNLTGWTTGLVPADTVEEQDDSVPPELHLTSRQATRIIGRFPAMLKPKMAGLERSVEIDPRTRVISIALLYNQTPLSLPVATSLDWYITRRSEYLAQLMTQEKLSAALMSTQLVDQARSRTIQLLGADIGGQRVSLQVAGNVTINGGVKFKDQEKSVTNYRAGSNWDLVVDQTQRFDITGSVGDRVDVTIHQDSENIFEWENAMKIAYKGGEDEILQTIDAGNISLSLPGTQFATGGGGGSKGLFGIKAVSKLGAVDITTIASVERSQKSTKSNRLSEALIIQDRLYLRNKYFFIDPEFRQSYYPLREDGSHVVNGNRVIKQLEIYLSSSGALLNVADTYDGTAFVNPAERGTATDSVQARFRRLELNVDYTAVNELGTIRMNSSAQDDDIIAVAYSLGRATGAAYDSVGSVGFNASEADDILILKLLKDRGQSVSSPTWQLAFKNVYSLGGININSEGFDVKIFDIQADGGRSDRLGSETFLKIFGLDQRTNSDQVGPPDDEIDTYNYNIVKLNVGELHFPALLPFAYSSVAGLATADTAVLEVYNYELEDLNGNFVFDEGDDLNGDGKWDVPELYYAPRAPKAARFEIEVQQSSAGASTYNLGFNMVPGSETVAINGQKLVLGQDYEIDMFSNTLTILHMEDYVNPDVTIEYEENSLVSFDKKVMLGVRAQMDLGESSFLGVTGLYYNQSIIDERVDVGSEPIRNMLWDVNGRLRRDAPVLTRFIDRLPFIETDAVSSFNLEGEFAQVLPNPNPLGAGYVDDFEASKRVSSPSLQYRTWKTSAPPIGKQLHDRRKMSWWNPFQDKAVQDIWPERETSIRANNLTTTILILDAFYTRFGAAPTDSLWSGITYPLLPGDYDQSQTKFFEIWLNGFKGRMHIDIGDISEDINGNGKIDTEDIPLKGTTIGNNLLDPGEDVGLDGCTDELEDGTGGCFHKDDDQDGRTDEETFNGLDDDGDGRIDEDLETVPPLVDLNDPNGDNWRNSSSNRSNDFINGTEGNSESADGSRPDTEDLNGTGSFVDARNDYFTASFSLDPTHADTVLVGGSTFKDGEPTGWRQFRIPLTDFELAPGKNATWDNVKNLRIWIDGLAGDADEDEATAQIQIAQIEFVGNEWVEIGIAHIDSSNFTKVDSLLNLAVTIVNTEDNPEYSKPPNVAGVFDRLNGIRLREQALSLDFRTRGLPPRTKAAVSKEIVNRSNDATFLAYRTMEMHIFGDPHDLGAPLMTDDLTYYHFWLRLGLGKTTGESYYELRKPIYPGWERNFLDIDLERLAALKNEEPDTMIVIDTDSLPSYHLDDGAEGILVIISGDPSVDRIGRYTAGVINTHTDRSIFGRVFIDELRLTDVRKEKGIAMRLSGSLKLADLMTTSFSYNRTDADFHTVQQKILRGPSTNETFQSNLLLNPDQVLPKSWGIKTPVSMSYKRTISSPKYFPGRDIRTGDLRTAPDSVQRKSEIIAVKVSFGKSARSRFWLTRQTLDRLTAGVTYQLQDRSDKNIANLNEQSISGNFSYPIKFSDENYIKPFGLIEKIPWLGGKLKDTRIYYSPSSLQVSANISEVISEQVNRAQIDSTLERYNFNLKRSAAAKYRLTDNINFDFSRNANSSLDGLRNQKLKALKTYNTGLDKQISENYSARFSPQIFSWLKPNISYQSTYQWSKVNPIDDPERGANIDVNTRLTTAFSLSPTKIIESVYKPAGARARPQRRAPRRTAPRPAQDTKEPAEVKNKQLEAILKLLHAGAQKILPITVNHSLTSRLGQPQVVARRGGVAVIGHPPISYRLGLSKISGLSPDSLNTGGLNLRSFSEGTDFSWKSGISLSKSANLNLSSSSRRSHSKGRSSETESVSRSFLVLSDEKGNIGLPLVDWNVRISGLEKLPILKLLPWTLSLEHSYNGTHVRNRQNQQAPVDSYKRNFQPLIGMTISFKNGVSANLRYGNQLSLNLRDSGDSKEVGNQISSSLNYQRRGGFTIPIPFFEDFKVDNTVNFSLTLEASSSFSLIRVGESGEFVEKSFNKNLSIKPYITYTFSKNVNGSFRFGYSERENPITGKTITRDIGFDVNMAIRGS